MDIVFSVLSVVFIGLIVAVAIVFGFVIFAWIMLAAILFAALMYLRSLWFRWVFVHRNTPHKTRTPPDGPRVIEGEYRDITDEK